MNALVQKYRDALAAQGVTDPRPDDYITLDLGKQASASNPGLFDQFPDFKDEYQQVREANAPGLGTEFGQAFKAGTQGLASTALQFGALGSRAVGLDQASEYLKGKAQSFEEDAAANAPTIPTLEDIGGVKDTLRYGIAKAGSALPSLIESAGVAAGGAVLGSAAAPGPGTIAGGATGLVGKSLVKSAIKKMLSKGLAEEMVAKGLVKEATEAGIEQAIKAGSKDVIAAVANVASDIAKFRSGVAANALSSFSLNTGDVASEGAGDATSMGLGIISAIPDTILPAYVLSKLFPGVAKKEAVELGKTFLARNARKIGELAGIPATEFGQEAFQQGVNVVARNIKEGKDPLTFTGENLREMREAGIAGAAGGLLAAPAVMVTQGKGATVRAQAAAKALEQQAGRVSVAPPETEAVAPNAAPVAPVSAARRVTRMTPEEQTVRLADLQAREAALPPDEQTELMLLQATVKPVAAPAAVAPVQSVAEAQAPASPIADGSEPPYIPTGVKPPESPVPPAQEPPPANPQILEPARVGPLTPQQVAAMSPAEFFDHYQQPGTGLTEDARLAGQNATTPEAIAALAVRRDKFTQDFNDAMAEKNTDDATALAAQIQYFSEAYQEATKTGVSAPATVSSEPTPVVEGESAGNMAEVPAPSEILPAAKAILEGRAVGDESPVERIRANLPDAAETLDPDAIGGANNPIIPMARESAPATLSPKKIEDARVQSRFGVIGTGPIMEQYVAVKRSAPDSIVLMRLGDFYEAFGDDAKNLSKALKVTLTKRQETPMAGIPYHSVERSTEMLAKAGYRVAMVDSGLKAGAAIPRKEPPIAQQVASNPTPEEAANIAKTGTPSPTLDTPLVREVLANPTPEEALNRAKTGTLSPTLDARYRAEEAAPEPFKFGKIADVSMDVPADIEQLSTEKTMTHGNTNTADTRVGALFDAPDGRVIMVGLLPPKKLTSVLGGSRVGIAVQSFSEGKGASREIKVNGKNSALIGDVIAAGYKYRGKIVFDAEPGKIYQSWSTPDIFNATVKAMAEKARVERDGEAPMGGAPLSPELERIERDAAGVNAVLKSTSDATQRTRLSLELTDLHDEWLEAGGDPSVRFMQEEPQQPRQPSIPVQSDRASELLAVASGLRSAGLKVDILTAGFLRADLAAQFQRSMEAEMDRYMATPEEGQPAIQRRIELLQKNIDAVKYVRGVQYDAWHIAIGLDDMQHQNINGLVGLMHEGGHSIIGRTDPAMQARIIRAVDGAFADLTAERTALMEKTGVRERDTSNPEELLVSTVAQRLAAEGVPNSPSLARAIVQWVKDLYYRMTMGVQEAFGKEADPQMALDWFENQLRRTVGGDYDYRFASMFDRLAPEPEAQKITRFTGERSGTPGGITDFFDPRAGRLVNPSVLPETREAMAWNFKLMAEDAEIGNNKELDIPAPEARARITAAAVAEKADVMQRAFEEAIPLVDGKSSMSPEEFWALAGKGDRPDLMLADADQQFPGAGTAKIGGDRMTEPMNSMARRDAKLLVYGQRDHVVSVQSRKAEASAKAETTMVDAAKKLTKIEGNLRNADAHEATLSGDLKDMIKAMGKGISRGLDTAFKAGGLSQAVREVEGLKESDAIPAEYQRVFKAVLHDEVPVFEYMDHIAKLDMDLGSMTLGEIRDSISANAAGDPVLDRLMEPKNKPLLVALTALAKKSKSQMDLLQMRAIKDPQAYLALKAELDEIRNATPQQLRDMEKKIDAGRKAATFADRIKRDAVKQRARLRRAQETIQEADATADILDKVRGVLDAKVTEMEVGGMAHPSEWKPFSGETYLAMRQGEDGRWTSVERPLQWNPDGTAVNGDQILRDLAGNQAYLADRVKLKGSKTYELVKQQVNELNVMDFNRVAPEIKRTGYEKFFLSTPKLLISGGGAGAARVEQKFLRYQFLIGPKFWHADVETPSINWAKGLIDSTKAAGMKDTRAFKMNVVEPVVSMLESEPGLDMGPALRKAVKMAHELLTTEATPAFDETFKDFVRQYIDRGDQFEKISDEMGNKVFDPKLGELREAVKHGVLTIPRSMRKETVSTILRDMMGAGWKAVFKDAKTEKTSVMGLDEGVTAGQRVVASASFDKLLPELADNEADVQARTAVVESPEAFSKAISGFFTDGIIERWLKPFINKPGESAFEGIDPLDLQAAWQKAGGNVAKWIDFLGERVGLEKEVDLGETVMQGDLSLEAQFRVDMLKKLDSLFLMESRIAADANQVKGLFDANGSPPHLIMDSRDNDLLPPEHVEHASFDPMSSRNLLATLAFHASFGRNGEMINRDIAEIEGGLKARKSRYQAIVESTNDKAERERLAKESGYEFKELKRAASIYKTVMGGVAAMKAQFGFNASATAIGDIRGFLQFINFIAQQVTNNLKTALLNMIQPTQRAIARGSIGPATIRDTGGAFGTSAHLFFGSALQALGIHLKNSSAYVAEIGASQGQGIGNLPRSAVIGMAAGRGGEQRSGGSQLLSTLSAIQHTGGVGKGEYPTLPVIPVVDQMMHAVGLNIGISNASSETRSVEGLVHAAKQHFELNPDHFADPTYKITQADIAEQSRILGLDPKTVEYFRRNMVAYGMGTLESAARDAMHRATNGDTQLLTKDQALKISMLSLNDIDLQGSINTNPSMWDTNRSLRLITPLLGWPIRQMASIHNAMSTPRGFEPTFEQFKQASKTLGILATWMLPAGLAFTFLTDQYDEKVLKKKTNLGRINALDVIPGGAVLSLAASDIPVKEHLLAIGQRLSRAGNIYGLGFDAFSQILAGTDPTSGQRQFSMDGRILAFSQLLNFTQAMSNWYNSGFATTYANFERPMIQATMGSGPLQAMDAIGAALGIDNQEIRIAQRTNASQWLRVAGREAGLELRRGGGGSVAPTPISVWTREMYLASLAGDRLDFQDAYRRAVDAAREADPDKDPEATVRESWQARDPRNVFAHKPDDTQMARLLGVMTDSGRAAVTDALRLYQQYTDMIALTPQEKYQHRMQANVNRSSGMGSLRSQMAGAALGFR